VAARAYQPGLPAVVAAHLSLLTLLLQPCADAPKHPPTTLEDEQRGDAA